MGENNKNKGLYIINRALSTLTGVFTVVVGVCLVYACLGIYRGGEGEYTRAAVADAFRPISAFVYTWLVLVILGLLSRLFIADGEGKVRRASSPQKRFICKSCGEGVYARRLRIALLVLGAALLIVGICMGGMADVLTKAINICTECVGLG